jgi:hypothetical protein
VLTIWGGKHRFCDRVSRRDFLQAGGLGLGGLTLADTLRLRGYIGLPLLGESQLWGRAPADLPICGPPG